MSTTFPRTKKLGYDVDQVEDFLEEARRAYDAPAVPDGMTAESIRRTAFRMKRGGYSPSHVDAALERLEDAFANRERDRAVAEGGQEAWYSRARETAQEILDRVARPDGRKFRKVGPLATGYHPVDVDRFAGRLIGYFQHGKPLTIDDVRTVAFRPKRGGYHEAQVDVLLDTVTSVMQAVR